MRAAVLARSAEWGRCPALQDVCVGPMGMPQSIYDICTDVGRGWKPGRLRRMLRALVAKYQDVPKRPLFRCAMHFPCKASIACLLLVRDRARMLQAATARAQRRAFIPCKRECPQADDGARPTCVARLLLRLGVDVVHAHTLPEMLKHCVGRRRTYRVCVLPHSGMNLLAKQDSVVHSDRCCVRYPCPDPHQRQQRILPLPTRLTPLHGTGMRARPLGRRA